MNKSLLCFVTLLFSWTQALPISENSEKTDVKEKYDWVFKTIDLLSQSLKESISEALIENQVRAEATKMAEMVDTSVDLKLVLR